MRRAVVTIAVGATGLLLLALLLSRGEPGADVGAAESGAPVAETPERRGEASGRDGRDDEAGRRPHMPAPTGGPVESAALPQPVALRIEVQSPDDAPMVTAMRRAFRGSPPTALWALASRGRPDDAAIAAGRERHGLPGGFVPAYGCRHEHGLIFFTIGCVELESLPAHVTLLLGTHPLESRLVEREAQAVSFVVTDAALAALASALTARVVDGRTGEPIPRARAWSQGAQILQYADAEGRIAVERLPPVATDFHLTADDYEALTVAVQPAPGRSVDLGSIALLPDERWLSGAVRDAAGSPVVFAEIRLRPLDDGGQSGLASVAPVVSGHDGDFTFWRLGARRYEVVAASEGRVSEPLIVDLREDDAWDLGLLIGSAP